MSKINKIITNKPITLTQEEVPNLSETLSAVIAAGNNDGTTYSGDGEYIEITGNNIITLTTSAANQLYREIPTKVSDLEDVSDYATVASLSAYQVAGDYLSANALNSLSGTWENVTAKLDKAEFGEVSGDFLTQASLNGYATETYVQTASAGITELINFLAGQQGPAGASGADGKDGITPLLSINPSTNFWEVSYDEGLTYSSLNVSATGPRGIQGIQGEPGPQGPSGISGTNGIDGITPQLRINDSTNFWEVSYNNGSSYTSLDVSATGPRGIQGETGPQGPSGTSGTNGINGDSAYQIAVRNGFSGTEVEWLASLHGEDGSAINPDWEESDLLSPAYIQNKPELMTSADAADYIDSLFEDVTPPSAIRLVDLNTAGITDIQVVNSLPSNPVSSVLYLIPES